MKKSSHLLKNYLSIEAQLLLATLAQHVTFELIPDQSLKLDPNKSLTMRTKNNIKMIVRRRAVLSCYDN